MVFRASELACRDIATQKGVDGLGHLATVNLLPSDGGRHAIRCAPEQAAYRDALASLAPVKAIMEAQQRT